MIMWAASRVLGPLVATAQKALSRGLRAALATGFPLRPAVPGLAGPPPSEAAGFEKRRESRSTRGTSSRMPLTAE